jgi:hypothetical protein
MRTDSSLVTVGEVSFRFKVHREPQWCGADGWKGLALAIEAVDRPGRNLIVELPFERSSHRSTPQRQRPVISVAEVERYIREAIDAGWDPDSRGKPFVLELPVPPNKSLERTREG